MDSLENEESRKRLRAFLFSSIAIYFVWVTFIAPPPPAVEGVTEENLNPKIEETKTLDVVDTKVSEPEGLVNENALPLETKNRKSEHISFDVSSQYGSMSNLYLEQYTQLPVLESWWGWLFDGMKDSWDPYSGGNEMLSILSEKGGLATVGRGDSAAENVYHLSTAQNGDLVSVARLDGLTIEKTYHIPENKKVLDQYTVEIDINIKNTGSEVVSDLWIGTFEEMLGDAGRFDLVSRPQFYVEDELVGTFATMFSTSFMAIEDLEEPTKFESPPEWFGIGSRYFLTALYPDKEVEEEMFRSVSTHKLSENMYGVIATIATPIDAGASRNIKMKAYVGPKQMDILEVLGDSWTQAVEFGMFGFFSKVLLFLLKVIQAGFVNWGVSILLLTLIVKVVFFPLTQKAFMSGKKMQALQPKLKEMKEKYKDNQQLIAQETMKMFKEHDVSPLGGCLPTVIQIPVWFSLYNVMLYSVELYDSTFLYLNDLTSQDPYGILPVMYCVLMLIQQKMMPMGNLDPAQAKMMKMMPLAFGIFMFTFPSGLVLYFSMNILLTIFQQWLIRIQFDEINLKRQEQEEV